MKSSHAYLLPLALLMSACSAATVPAATLVPTLTRMTQTPSRVAPSATPSPAHTPSPTVTPEPTITPSPTAIALADPNRDQLSLDHYALEEVAGDFARPVFLTHAGDGSGRLFIVDQPGVIYVVRDGVRLETPYLDLTDRVTDDSNEQGLLGLAFSPSFAEDGRFYVYYTAEGGGANTIARFRADPLADVADANSEQVLLAVDDPYGNHNGGMLAFGPDGYLYAGLGDGGAAGDPQDNGQDLTSLLGKILRLDVAGDDLAVPVDNPFDAAVGRPEIWVYGLRNPWRFSFDRVTGDLYIGDVGQNIIEEVDYLPAGAAAGANLGWRVFEGSQPYDASGLDAVDPVPPILEYRHGADGCSITGGYVYRGGALADLNGIYFYGDYCSGLIWAAWSIEGEGAWVNQVFGDAGFPISSFAEDEVGELYVIDHGGVVYRLVSR
ncbi:MAG TPA: PQQ-dependent sugar dehydrogenase [Anaerolineales bacterium]|nr:PQQ-dependent sugar dehydrogenase [Anaerolineales bacterium]